MIYPRACITHDMLKRYPRQLLGAFVAATLLLAGVRAWSIYATMPAPGPSSTTSAPYVGTITANLGTRSDLYGSKWQGIELLERFNGNPNTARFVISANDGRGERLELVVDRSSDTLERKHWTTAGSGTSEVWKGNLKERLQQASSGDGFNYGSGTARGPLLSSI